MTFRPQTNEGLGSNLEPSPFRMRRPPEDDQALKSTSPSLPMSFMFSE